MKSRLQMNITVVELEPTMVEIARKYFGLKEDETQRVVVMDGLEYLQDSSRKGSSSEYEYLFVRKVIGTHIIRGQEMKMRLISGIKYDAIYIDACPTRFPFEVEVMCPIPIFLNETNIQTIRSALLDTGLLNIRIFLSVDS
ncbi:unnamed protein product [Anisakis simplex]|uniref:PABS domain-containing protein n=1 Tax=Anisakis simplex TaxID=6269 RepID=A0A0M3KJJ9_ANISI|nr:unnamed protein product [Anisakis simplex]